MGEPDAGNLHVRFDEGRGDSPSYSTGYPAFLRSLRVAEFTLPSIPL